MAAIVKMMTATEATAETKRFAKAFRTADKTAAKIRREMLAFDQREGWKAMGYSDFGQWAAKCLPWARRQCYYYLAASKVEDRIAGEVGPPVEGDIPVKTLLALEKIPDNRQANVFQKAVDLANQDNTGETLMPSSKHVKAAVRQHKLAEPVSDERGTPMTDAAGSSVFEEAAGFDVVMSALGLLKTKVNDLACTEAGLMLAEELQSIEHHRQEMYRMIRFCRPFAECIYCGGGGNSKGRTCRGCKGRGWLNEATMKQAPKETHHGTGTDEGQEPAATDG